MHLRDLAVSLSNDVIDFAGDIALETADRFKLRMPLADAFVDVGLCASVGSQATDGNDVQGAVGRAIPAAIQSMSRDLTRRRRDGAYATKGGEAGL